MYNSFKKVEGFSTCFRQWKAEGTHCRFLHGYGIYFILRFGGELDERNWVWDFGGFKRAKTKIKWDGKEFSPKDWFEFMFDHTTVIAEDDPELDSFKELANKGIIQLRIVPKVGCEIFAKLVFDVISEFLQKETNGRVKLLECSCHENERNSASYW